MARAYAKLFKQEDTARIQRRSSDTGKPAQTPNHLKEGILRRCDAAHMGFSLYCGEDGDPTPNGFWCHYDRTKTHEIRSARSKAIVVHASLTVPEYTHGIAKHTHIETRRHIKADPVR